VKHRLLALLVLIASTTAHAEIIVNGITLPAATVQSLHQAGIPARDGNWWYDSRTGAFGAIGGPTAGFLMPGLPLGGPLRADASGGGDGRYGGVFINGRELHPQDIAALAAQIGQVQPGRYWVDAAGNFGYEGGGMLGNLRAMASSASARGPRGSAASGCNDASCRNSRSWSGDGYFSDGKTGCIVMDGEVTC
jgi:hypothetical protein